MTEPSGVTATGGRGKGRLPARARIQRGTPFRSKLALQTASSPALSITVLRRVPRPSRTPETTTLPSAATTRSATCNFRSPYTGSSQETETASPLALLPPSLLPRDEAHASASATRDALAMHRLLGVSIRSNSHLLRHRA